MTSVIVEVSPSWGGYGKRDLEVWAELSRRTGINIVATSGHLTGYSDLPPYFHDSTPEQLADEFIHDIQEGAHGTNIKTGMLKAHIRDDADGRKRRRLK